MDDVILTFDDEVYEYIVDKAIEYKLGARGLRSIVENIMIDAMFNIPSSKQPELHINKEYAVEQLEKSQLVKLKNSQ
jgi:ATP-dependent Clp protease ATP-binding subunit ClpX